MKADIFVILAGYIRHPIILRCSKLAGYYDICLIAQYFRNGAQSPVKNAILSESIRRLASATGNIRVYIGLFRVIILSYNRVITIPRIKYEKYIPRHIGYYYKIPGMQAYSITPRSSRCWYDNEMSITYRNNGEIIIWMVYDNIKVKARLKDNNYSIVILEYGKYKYSGKIGIINKSTISYDPSSNGWKWCRNTAHILLDDEPYYGYYSHGRWHTEYSIYTEHTIYKLGEIDKYYGYMNYSNENLMFEYYLGNSAIFYNKNGRIIREYKKK
jgi:hypothetical protein